MLVGRRSSSATVAPHSGTREVIFFFIRPKTTFRAREYPLLWSPDEERPTRTSPPRDPRQVESPRGVHGGHLRGLSPEEGASRLPAPLGDPRNDRGPIPRGE